MTSPSNRPANHEAAIAILIATNPQDSHLRLKLRKAIGFNPVSRTDAKVYDGSRFNVCVQSKCNAARDSHP